MSKQLDRIVEIRVLDNRGKRVEGATLTIFVDDQTFVIIQRTRDKDTTIQIANHDSVISIDIEYHVETDPDGERLRVIPPPYANSVTLAQNQNEWIFVIPPKHFANTIFIGCSVEGQRAARLIQEELEHFANTVIWWEGVFGLTQSTVETLVEKAHKFFTHAILVLTPDDMLVKRANTVTAARDNVLFELGLFMGALGRDRTFIVAEESVRLPTNLAGITTAVFQQGTGLTANMGSVVTRILRAMGLL